MNIVILHYHFQRGGVTQVVQNHVRWLKTATDINRIVLVSGNRTDGLSDEMRQSAEQFVVDELEYDFETERGDAAAKASLLSDRLADQFAARGIDSSETILHWHNHSLGKNTAAPAAVRTLAAKGWRSLLHIHDFAEDGRPANYRRVVQGSAAASKRQVDAFLYPLASNIHYATLTDFDSNLLGKIGVPAEQRSVLPNAVTPPTDFQSDSLASIAKVRRAMSLPGDAKWCIYPVRGIRRKNVGEFVLLSRLTPPDVYSGITLCPTTPIERDSYRRWQRYAAELAPRGVFDAAHHPDVTFADNLAASQYILSTSVAEGFGMAFLEPWLAGREVISRHLPSVFDDFEQAGIQFPARYSSIPVPGTPEWIRECDAEITADRRRAWSSVAESFRPGEMDQHHPTSASVIDFARLLPKRQTEVLQRVATDASFEADLKQLSSELVAALHAEPDDALIRRNADRIRNRYSLETTGNELQQLYAQIMQTSDTERRELASSGEPAIDVINRARPYFACRTEDPIHV